MKIERDKKDLRNYTPLGRTSDQGVKRSSESSFDQELNGRRESESQFRMQELIKQIDSLNENLKRNLNLNDLMLYKKLVKKFLQEATTRAFSLQQQRSRNRRGRSLLITVQTIDREVEAMINDFIKQKTEPLEILTMLDKIRGMLVDLIV